MTCAQYRSWIEGRLGGRDAGSAGREEHLRQCPDCRLWTQARLLPREEPPPRDLWPSIEGRIVGGDATADSGWGWSTGLAAAAALVLLLSGGLLLAPSGGTGSVHRAATPPDDRPAQVRLNDIEKGLAESRMALLAIIDAQLEVPLEQREELERTLASLDGAIINLRQALHEEPDDSDNIFRLTRVYWKELELLKDAGEGRWPVNQSAGSRHQSR